MITQNGNWMDWMDTNLKIYGVDGNELKNSSNSQAWVQPELHMDVMINL